MDGYICIWDTVTNTICKYPNGENKIFDAHEDGVRQIAYCYTTNEIISCGYGKQSDSTTLYCSVWDFNSHKVYILLLLLFYIEKSCINWSSSSINWMWCY